MKSPSMSKKKSADRHSADSVQLKAWLPVTLRSRFNTCCKAQGVPAAAVLRDLMEAYCVHVEEVDASGQGEAVHVAS